MEITPQNLDFLFKEYSSAYELGFANRQVYWQEIADRLPSSTEANTYGWLAEIPGFREWIGPRVFHNLASRSYQVVNKDWDDGFTVSKNKIADDQYGIYSNYSRLLGDAAKGLWDQLVFDQLLAGETTTCFDGQFFFDTDHPVDLDSDAKGTYSNLYTAKPLTAANISFLSTKMLSYKGESGRSLQLHPDLVLAPPELGLDLASALAPVVSSNNAAVPNPLTLLQGIGGGRPVRGLIIPQLSQDPGSYYVVCTTKLKPVILQVRQEPNFVQRTDPQLDPVFYRKEYEFGADARGNAGYGLPVTIIKAKIS